jgi:very-short-patch-repair endonuclease
MSLLIELDGGQHQDKQKAYDARRTAILNKGGFRILRFWNHEVLQHTEEVLEAIYARPSPQPSPANRFRVLIQPLSRERGLYSAHP